MDLNADFDEMIIADFLLKSICEIESVVPERKLW